MTELDPRVLVAVTGGALTNGQRAGSAAAWGKLAEMSGFARSIPLPQPQVRIGGPT